jgi:hypothetical protein
LHLIRLWFKDIPFFWATLCYSTSHA